MAFCQVVGIQHAVMEPEQQGQHAAGQQRCNRSGQHALQPGLANARQLADTRQRDNLGEHQADSHDAQRERIHGVKPRLLGVVHLHEQHQVDQDAGENPGHQQCVFHIRFSCGEGLTNRDSIFLDTT